MGRDKYHNRIRLNQADFEDQKVITKAANPQKAEKMNEIELIESNQIENNLVKVVVRKFGRGDRAYFGHEVFLPLRQWQIRANIRGGGDDALYPKNGYCSWVGWGSVFAAIKTAREAADIHPESVIEIHKNARAQFGYEMSSEF